MRRLLILVLASLAPALASAHCHVQYQVVGPGGLFYQADIGAYSYLGYLPGGTTSQLGPNVPWTDLRVLEVFGTIQVGLTATDLTGSVACAQVPLSLDGPPSCSDDAVPEVFPPCTPTFTITQTGPNAYSCATSCPAYPQPHTQAVPADLPPATPAGSLSVLTPGSTPPQSPALALGVGGSGFVNASQVEWNGTPLTTVYLDPSTLVALVPSSFTDVNGVASVTVLNPGGASTPLSFSVTSTTTSPAPPPPPPGSPPPSGPTDLSAAGRVYPNPWRPSAGSPVVTFDALPGGTTIKLFSLSGALVKTLDASGGSATWDLTNRSGESVASGYYFYLMTDGLGGKKRGRLALIR